MKHPWTGTPASAGMNSPRRSLVALATAGLVLLAQPLIALTVEVGHHFGDQPLRLSSLRYENPTGDALSVTRLSYLLSGFETRDVSGVWHAVPEAVAFIDLSKRRTRFELPTGTSEPVTGLRFHVGLPENVNHADPASYPGGHPLNPNFNRLHWNWQQGYIFLALEGRYRKPDHELGGYVFHLANNWNLTPVELSLSLPSAAALHLDFDLSRLLTLSFQEDGHSTHSGKGDVLAGKLRANLAAAFSLRPAPAPTPAVTSPRITPKYLPPDPKPLPLRIASTFPRPSLPLDNPLLKSRVVLGKKLFHDASLSRTGEISCASCHDPALGFSDDRRFSLGIHGRAGRRHSMPLFNLAWKREFFWDGRSPSLRDQVLEPLRHPREMGESPPRVVEKVEAAYADELTAAFGSLEANEEKIAMALENFLLTLTSFDSKFDRAMAGKAELSASEQRGFQLFFTEYEPRAGRFGADCFHCHGGALFTDHQFHNNGLPPKSRDRGRAAVTRDPGDAFKFATPSLRNVALTAPYMHDGRFATLEEVVDHYSSGVRRGKTLDPNLAKHPAGGLDLSPEARADLVAFLKTLSDPRVEYPGPN